MTFMSARDFVMSYGRLTLKNIDDETAIKVANSLREDILDNYYECEMDDWEYLVEYYKMECRTRSNLDKFIKRMKKMVFT